MGATVIAVGGEDPAVLTQRSAARRRLPFAPHRVGAGSFCEHFAARFAKSENCAVVQLGLAVVSAQTLLMQDLSRDIAKKLKFVREAYGWNKTETETRAGLSSGHLTRIENGDRARILSVDVLEALARALKIRDLNWLVWGKIRHRDLLPECVTRAAPGILSPREELDFEKERISAPRARRRRKTPPHPEEAAPRKKAAKRGA